MSYFDANYESLKFPITKEGRVGFREAQIAAAFAVRAHFFSSAQPAIVTMPTGAGKTTVLMAIAFLLRAKRVLVLTPSRLVREQIAENFNVLLDLKRIEAIPRDQTTPQVYSTKNIINSAEEWGRLRQYDVIVATVPSVSSGINLPTIPTDIIVITGPVANHAQSNHLFMGRIMALVIILLRMAAYMEIFPGSMAKNTVSSRSIAKMVLANKRYPIKTVTYTESANGIIRMALYP